MDAKIAELKVERERLAADRRKVRKELKNAMKRRSRLKKKAAKLSNTDLFDLIKLRELNAQLLGQGAEPCAAAAADAEAAEAAATEPEGACHGSFLFTPADVYYGLP